MSYNLSGEDIAISGPVHRALNDVVNQMTDGNISGWEDNYRIFLESDGKVDARPTKQNSRGGFQSRLTHKLVFLPTPEWVRNSKQKVYICFFYELEKLMGKWWEDYANMIR